MNKYIIDENNVMRPNPAYQAAHGQKTENTLPVVSSTDDIMEANQLLGQYNKKPLGLTGQTATALNNLQTDSYLAMINAPTNSVPIDELTRIFSKYEIPIGMLHKLFDLSRFKLNLIIDDSGSMANHSDALMSEAHEETKKRHDPTGARVAKNGVMTRFEEAEDRLYKMIEILAYIPNQGIKISFLNRNDVINLQQQERTPRDFTTYGYQQIANAFQRSPNNGTPVYTKLSNAFNDSRPTMHYLFTDGLPTDCSINDIYNLILRRKSPENHPLTLIACTNESDLEWMKKIDQEALYTAEIDDFVEEKKEVCTKQGSYFPFNRGFWLLCQLVAAINPTDFDALDEDKPLSRDTLSKLMGYELTPESYQVYFSQHPKHYQYQSVYSQLLNERNPNISNHMPFPGQGQMQPTPYPSYPMSGAGQIQPPAYAPTMYGQGQGSTAYQAPISQQGHGPAYYQGGSMTGSGQGQQPLVYEPLPQANQGQVPGPVYQSTPLAYPTQMGLFQSAATSQPNNGQNLNPSNYRP